VYHWKKQYGRGKLDNEPTQEAAMQDRIDRLEKMVGKLA
jgi:transposase